MEYTRNEIMPGVFLTHLRSDKFKTACMSVTLLTQLTRENAAMNALIPMVLRRGTSRYGDMEQLSRRMDELYGTAIEPVIRRLGEIQCIGFFASYMTTRSRRKEFAVMRCLGMNQRKIFAIVFLMALETSRKPWRSTE